MILFKPYSSINGFLKRFTILKIGKLHIRLHRITDKDKTTLYHNHPFKYISIILKGGYSEKYLVNGIEKIAKHGFLSIIIRDNTVFHRIESIDSETTTLFIAYGNYGWHAINTETSDGDGLYKRTINGISKWSKKENGIWFIGHTCRNKANEEIRHSIHQHINNSC